MGSLALSLTEIEAVYRARGADFFRLALARTGDRERARDAVQEGFAAAIRGRDSYRGSGSVEAWVARCVLNASHDALRAERRRGAPVGPHADPVQDEPSEAGFANSVDPDVALVRRALRGLPRRQRDALFLRHYLDLEYAAIAEALGIEVGTVSATLHAARAALAEQLEEVLAR